MLQRTLPLLLLLVAVALPSAGRATPPPPDLYFEHEQAFDVDTELQRIQQLVADKQYDAAIAAIDALLARDVLDAGQLAIASSLRDLVERARGLEWKKLEEERERERKKAERQAEQQRRRQREKERARRLAREFRDRQDDREGRYLRLETGLHSGAYMYDSEPASSSAAFRRFDGGPIEGEVGGAALSMDLRGEISPVELWVLQGRMDLAPFAATRDLEDSDDVDLAMVQGPVGAYRSSIRSGLRLPTKAVDVTFLAGYQHERVTTYVQDADAPRGIARQVDPAHLFTVGGQIRTHFEGRRCVRELGFWLEVDVGFQEPLILDHGLARRTFALDGEYGFGVQFETGFELGMRLRMTGAFNRYMQHDAGGEIVKVDGDPELSEIHVGYGLYVGFAV